MSNRISYAFAVLLLLAAAALRLWDLTALPAGFSENEFQHIRLMEDGVQRGDIRVFYQIDNRGQEGLYHILLALSGVLFGEGTLGLRILSVFAGLITIALVYSIGMRLFRGLAGLYAAGLVAVLLNTTLLSRLVLVEALVPMLVAAILLAIVRALPVYERNRPESSNTIDFALLGTVTGIGLYLHPAGLMLVLVAALFIAYSITLRGSFTRRQISYTGFAILMMIIIGMPYVISTIRLPELDANSRIIGNYGTLSGAVINAVLSIAGRGDLNPLHNLPERPLLDLVSAVLIAIGIAAAVRGWRHPRYGLLLITGAVLIPPAMLATNSPNFQTMSILMPVLALFAGAGLALLVSRIPHKYSWLGVVAVLILLTANGVWTAQDLFTHWAARDDVRNAYNADLGDIAYYLDRSADEIPTVVCDSTWRIPRRSGMRRSSTERIYLMMNSRNTLLRPVDCREGFLFVNAGAHQQVLIADQETWNALAPDVADWLALGSPVEGLPVNSMIELRVQTALEDALGVYTTTTPASFATAEGLSERVPVAPPIRFGGNITWLGYEADPVPAYEPGMTVSVITFWRIEGLVPSDLVIFTHILSDPVTIAANRDTMNTNPSRLRERDVYLHIANISLPNSILDGQYVISVGTYQSTSDERLPVFGPDNAVRGDKLFLYPIDIFRPDSTSDQN